MVYVIPLNNLSIKNKNVCLYRSDSLGMNDCMCKYVCALVSLENHDSKSCNLVRNGSTLFQSYVEHCMNADCWHKLSPLCLTENSFLLFFTSFREQYSLWSSCCVFQTYHPEDADTESINSTVIYAISLNIYMKYIYFRSYLCMYKVLILYSWLSVD